MKNNSANNGAKNASFRTNGAYSGTNGKNIANNGARRPVDRQGASYGANVRVGSANNGAKNASFRTNGAYSGTNGGNIANNGSYRGGRNGGGRRGGSPMAVAFILSLLLLAAVLIGLVLAGSGAFSQGDDTTKAPDGTSDPSVTTASPDTSGNSADTGENTSGTAAPPDTETPVTEPPTPSEQRVSFVAAGDCIVHDAVREDAKKRADSDDPNYNFYDMFEGVAEVIGNADISYINMEGCVGGASLGYAGYPDFNAPKEIAEAFVKLGFDVVNIANNHMLDHGEAGYRNTLDYFNTLPFTTIGGIKGSDNGVRIVEKGGVKIAFLSYTTLVNWAHVNSLSAGSDLSVPYAEDGAIKSGIAAARAMADFVCVSMHWGDEDAYQPNAEQKRLAQVIASAGADVIVGMHSHTIQPIEWIEGEGGHKTLVTYSLGNFISTMHYSQNMAGYMLSLDFVVTPEGEKRVENVKAIPTVCHYSLSRDSLQIYLMKDYSEALASKHGSTLQNAFSYSILKGYTNSISEYID